MKFPFAQGALALTALLTLASCGGGKETFPITVTVYNVLYDGLVLSTNGQDVAVPKPADTSKPVTVTFPNQIEYGQSYRVLPKGLVYDEKAGTITGTASYPQHQTCDVSTSYPYNLPASGTAGQLAAIQIYYVCTINSYPLTGKVTGLKGTGLTLANGSGVTPVAVTPAVDANNVVTGADVALTMNPVAFNTTYGVTVLTQPAGQTCTVSGGANGNGTGTMDETTEKVDPTTQKNGVNNLLVECK